ncbi:MAG: hypothetical protein R2860_12615 [Desulfobacterales bacterium]
MCGLSEFRQRSQPRQPDWRLAEGFSVAFQGGSQNNSTSITIVNGKMTRNISRGMYFHTS